MIAIYLIFKGIKLYNEKARMEQINDIKTNLLTIQGKIKTIKGKADVEGNEELLIGIKVSSVENEDIKNKLRKLKISDEDFEKYFILNTDELKQMGIDIESNEDYIVNYDIAEVIYVKGIFQYNRRLYKLSDMIRLDSDEKDIFCLWK